MASYSPEGFGNPRASYEMTRNIGASISDASKNIAAQAVSAADYIGRVGVRERLIGELTAKYPEIKSYSDQLKTMSNEELAQKTFMIRTLEEKQKAIGTQYGGDIQKSMEMPSPVMVAMETPSVAQLDTSKGIYDNLAVEGGRRQEKQMTEKQLAIFKEGSTKGLDPADLTSQINSSTNTKMTPGVKEAMDQYFKDYMANKLAASKERQAASRRAFDEQRQKNVTLTQAKALEEKTKFELETEKETLSVLNPTKDPGLAKVTQDNIDALEWRVAYWQSYPEVLRTTGNDPIKAAAIMNSPDMTPETIAAKDIKKRFKNALAIAPIVGYNTQPNPVAAPSKTAPPIGDTIKSAKGNTYNY